MATTPTPPSAGLGSVLKRILVGRPMASNKAEHQLLPKALALPVFSSDALSSVAYATEEMMLVLAVAGVSALSYMMPIGLAIAALLAIVVTSYRQTVRAYPLGGGSYIVTRENVGTVPGLVAAAAILTDYVLTVAVSVTAGSIAVTSAAPALADHKVILSVTLIVLITLANLRGVREAGTLFAVPTYGFVAMVAVTLATGLIRCLTSCPVAESANLRLEAEAGLTVFLILRAFSSGATALTGVEAIADGVQAFRRPQSKNAAATLAIMGVISITMFLGITVLARALDVRVHEGVAGAKSVLAQIGDAVFSGGPLFIILQVFTAGILILAANTAFQDFPRLSAILARDRFMPSQFRNRGDRLVFSNGVIVLAALAGLLIWAFDANLTKLIQLYVVGVFTAFTLSQTGMVRRWITRKGENWRRRATINGIGASATGVVLIVVTVTKFSRGAWIVITAIPVIVLIFVAIHRHYEAFSAEIRRGRVTVGAVGVNHVVLLVPEVDAATAEALGYVRSIRPEEVHVLYPSLNGVPGDVQARWQELAVGGPRLEPLALDGGDLLTGVRRYLKTISCRRRDFITVVIPELVHEGLATYLVRRRSTIRLKSGLLRERNVVVADVPVHVSGGLPVGVDGRPLIPQRTVALVFVSGVHDATVRAVNYAMSLEASDRRAVYFALDPEESRGIQEEWGEKRLSIPLDIVEAPFRDLTVPILQEVRAVTAREDTVCAVVFPEFVVSKRRHVLLHGQNALFLKRLMLFEPRVVLSSVPFALGMK